MFDRATSPKLEIVVAQAPRALVTFPSEPSWSITTSSETRELHGPFLVTVSEDATSWSIEHGFEVIRNALFSRGRLDLIQAFPLSADPIGKSLYPGYTPVLTRLRVSRKSTGDRRESCHAPAQPKGVWE